MGMSDIFRGNILDHIFLNAAITLIGDAPGLPAAATVGSVYVSLHTADPAAGDQTTNAATYTGYARVAMARSGAGWVRVSNSISNAAAATFPACTGGSSNCTHFGVGTDAAGAGKLIGSNTLTAALAVSNGVQPNFPIGSLTVIAT